MIGHKGFLANRIHPLLGSQKYAFPHFYFLVKTLVLSLEKKEMPCSTNLPDYPLTKHLIFLSLWNKFICPFPITYTISYSTHHSSKLLGKISFRKRNFQVNVSCNSRISAVKEFSSFSLFILFCPEKDLKKLDQMNVFSIKKWSSSSSDIKISISRLF